MKHRRKKKRAVAKSHKRKKARKPATRKSKRRSVPRKRKRRVLGVKKKTATKKRRSRKKKPQQGRTLVKYVERASTERVMAGRRKRAKRKGTRRTHHTTRKRGRKVSGISGGTGLLVGLAVGLGGLYLLSKSTTPTAPPYPSTQYPALQYGSNSIRNSQASEIVSYAIAAGYAVDAITKLIDYLNKSDDSDVQATYNHIDSGGDLGNWV